MNMRAKSGRERVVIVGTGTEVGKTHVSCALLAAASSQGRRCAGLKPVETGMPEPGEGAGEDGRRLASFATGQVFHVKQKAPYRFSPPISPHLAARQAGVAITAERIRDYVEAYIGEGTLVVETAGGLFSPLGPGLTNFDVVLALEPCRVVLVASDRLGVLHDLTATIGLAKARGRGPDVVVLSSPSEADSSTGTNANELSALGICEVRAVFPREAPDSAGSRVAADLAWGAVESSPEREATGGPGL